MNSIKDKFPDDFLRMIFLWQDIKENFFQGRLQAINRYENAFKSAAWAWTPLFKEVDSKSIDRRKDMLIGPLFSSINSPWPKDEFGPMIPLAQFNLSAASKIKGEDLGQGLLQVFCSQGDESGKNVLVREVEPEILEIDELTAPPTFADNLRGFASVSWAQGENSLDREIYGGHCLQIEGYFERRFNLWLPGAISDEYSLDGFDGELINKIKEFDDIFRANEDSWHCGGFHLFGSFSPSQYHHADRGTVFFTFESEFGFNFSDGQGQLFFTRHEKYGPLYSFDWACF